MFFDEGVDIARYDQVKYPQIEKITGKQLGFFWRPEEVDVSKDKKDFHDLSKHEQHIFTSNLKRQILLDSVQGRARTLLSFLSVRYPSWRIGLKHGPFLKRSILVLILILLGIYIRTLV